MSRPVEIVGGGLAGLALGRLLLLHGIPVTVYEAGGYPRHRVCGEFLCGLRPEVAAALEIGGILRDAQVHDRVTWHWRARPVRTHRLPKPALGLSRHALDARLARAFTDGGGELRTGVRVDPAETGPGRIWATGRRAGRSEWLGLKVHCRGGGPADGLEFHLGEGAYLGLSAVEGGEVNVCGLFRRRPGISAPPDQLLFAYMRACGIGSVADRIEAHRVPATHAAVAALSFARNAPDDRPAVGDAFAMIPPFTGDGMSIAFESAFLAAEPLLDFARGRCDWAAAVACVRHRLRTRLGFRLALAGLLQRILVRPGGQAAFAWSARRNLLPFALFFRWLH
jgi:flavin-dependent dehydrogenase